MRSATWTISLLLGCIQCICNEADLPTMDRGLHGNTRLGRAGSFLETVIHCSKSVGQQSIQETGDSMNQKSTKKSIHSASIRKSICFVTETRHAERPLQDASARYRCYHPAETLLSMGHRCSIYSAAKFFETPDYYHDVYVFHRPNTARANFLDVLSTLRRQRATLIADYDDLIFGDSDIAMNSSAVKNGTLDRDKAVQAFASNLAALQEFDKVSASTEPLAEHVRANHPDAQVEVQPNFLPASLLQSHEEMRTPYVRRPSVGIGYFAGTRSHDHDFPVVEAVLHKVLSENPNFNLLVVGPVHVPYSIATLPNVMVAPVVNFLRLPALMSTCATVIAPLEKTRFNVCKSRVKFLEAALAGCRLIASPIPDMAAVGPENLTLADNGDEWYEALSLVPDAKRHSKLVERNFTSLGSATNMEKFQMIAGLA